MFLLIPREYSGKSNPGYEHGHGLHVHEWLLDPKGSGDSAFEVDHGFPSSLHNMCPPLPAGWVSPFWADAEAALHTPLCRCFEEGRDDGYCLGY